MRSLLAFFCLAVMAGSSAAAAAETPPQIYATLKPRVARIEFEGELFNGDQEAGTGTAFLITDDGYLLTCKHVVPELTNYKTSSLVARFGALDADARPVTVVWISPDEDLALLKVEPAADLAAISLEGVVAPPGTDVLALGFPVNLDLSITKGIVSGPGDKGRYVMDAALNPGNSGGPIVDLTGRAVGVAWGAALRWKVGSEELPLQGIHYFIPAKRVLADLPSEFRNHLSVGVKPVLADLPAFMKQAFPIDLTKRTSLLSAFFKSSKPPPVAILRAQPGYRITGWQIAERSGIDPKDVHVVIAPNGGAAVVEQVGALLHGRPNATIQLTQEKLEAASP